MGARVVAVLGVVMLVAGCFGRDVAKPSGFVDGTSVHTISVGGHDRTYRLYKPKGLPASAPLVVMLHGGFGNGAQAEKSYGWDELADSSKFVVAYPDGLNRAWNVNGGGCCGRSAKEGIDDVAFVTAAVADIRRNVGIDAARVYVTGISNGGIMSYTLACETAIFAAIGPDSATQLNACDSPHPTSVMHIHGTADRLIRYDGGRGAGVAHIDGPPVSQLNAFWRNVNHCGAPASTTSGSVTTSTAGCPDNRSVVLITVDGGGHQWPGFATAKLWEFFAAHPR
ncbi:MAG: PHB depolymerase family esterase [Mycobacterium sp.]|uniref:extracellular catalytic domain type 1 short-chain-length polyhydroxyalkanoate depolymerase n=1 Tax=Mycobacterium sp. TaxID=1785 RepID=UPI003C4CDC72